MEIFQKMVIMIRKSNGFTYLETLISMAVLCIFMVPVLGAFVQAGQNFQYAVEIYTANLLAGNILTETEAILSSHGQLKETDSDLLWDFLQAGNPGEGDFDTIYQTDRYDYVLEIAAINETDSIVYYSRPDMPEYEPSFFGGENLVAPSSSIHAADAAIWLDGTFETPPAISSTFSIEATAYTCQVTVSGETPGDILLDLHVLHLDSPVSMTIINNSASFLLLRIIRDMTIDDHFISVNCEGSSTLAVQFIRPIQNKLPRMASVSVYDQKGKLLKRKYIILQL